MTTRDDPLEQRQFEALTLRLDALVQEVDALPYPAVRELVFELLQTIDGVHRAALTRLTDRLRATGHDPAAAPLADDPLVRTLLALYDLAPDLPDAPAPPDTPVAPPAPDAFIPLGQIALASRRPDFREVARLDALPPGVARGVLVEGVAVLLANVAGEVYAVRDACPGSVAPLSLGVFTPPIIVCPWHNEAFDVRTGKRADGEPGAGLRALPVAVRDGAVLLAMDANPQTAGRR